MELKITHNKGVTIQDDLIGIFFEDINYGADGGLYAEMLENRSFEFLDARGDKDAYHQIFDGLYGWSAYPKEQAELQIQKINPLNNVNPHYMHVQAHVGSGFTNQAYEGIFLEEGHSYRLSFYARSEQNFKVQVAALEKATGKKHIFTNVLISNNDWHKYTVSFTVDETIRYALFAILFEEQAEADFDCISLFPENAVCGLFRKDLAEKLKDMHPKFMRFPGGCVVEGNELTNRYQWKLSVGDITQRKANWNRWAVHENCEENHFTSKFSHYNQTLGLGYYEYFVLCEYLGAKPLPVANVGLACQYQSTQLVERKDPAYQEFIQDVLDLIEFANGASDSQWGKIRAQMGHPEPFGLEYVGIGNEQWQTARVDFFERYDDFEKAIHAKYPEIKLISSAGPTVHTPTYEAAWENYHAKAKNNSNYTYAVDEHYYMEPEWFLANTHFYDDYSRDVKVFSGEYAAHDKEVKESTKRNNWRCALSEAAFLTGVERNADVVYLASYAPLFARIGYEQWAPDLIWFDDRTSYATPNYYVQQLYSDYTGKHTINSDLPGGEESGVYHIVSADEQGHLYVKLVNASDKEQNIVLHIDDAWNVNQNMPVKQIRMQAQPLDVNSIEEPDKVSPKVTRVNYQSELNLPAYSFTVLDIGND